MAKVLQRNKTKNSCNNVNVEQTYTTERITVLDKQYRSINLEFRKVYDMYAKQKYGANTPEYLPDIVFDETFQFRHIRQVSRLINRYVTAHFLPLTKAKSDNSSVALYVQTDDSELRNILFTLYKKYVKQYVQNISEQIEQVGRYIQVFTIVLVTAGDRDTRAFGMPLYAVYERRVNGDATDKAELHKYNTEHIKLFVQQSKAFVDALGFEHYTLRKVLAKAREGKITLSMRDIIPLIKVRIFGLVKLANTVDTLNT